MSTIKLEIPSNNMSALFHFGNALLGMSKGVPVENNIVTPPAPALETVTPPASPVPETVTPPAPPADAPEFTPVYMYDLENDVYFIAKSQKDVDDHLVDGFIMSTDEDFKAWSDENKSSEDEFDSEGIVWDERIHSDTKSKNADGTWRVRRKPKETEKSEWEIYVSTVKAELAGAAGSVTPPAPPADTLETVTPPAPPADTLETVTPPAPPADALETVTPPAPPADALETVTFAALMKLITGNGVKLDVVKEVLAKNDVPALPLLNSSASEKLAAVYAGIKSIVEG